MLCLLGIHFVGPVNSLNYFFACSGVSALLQLLFLLAEASRGAMEVNIQSHWISNIFSRNHWHCHYMEGKAVSAEQKYLDL